MSPAAPDLIGDLVQVIVSVTKISGIVLVEEWAMSGRVRLMRGKYLWEIEVFSITMYVVQRLLVVIMIMISYGSDKCYSFV